MLGTLRAMPKPKSLHIFRAGRQTTKAGDDIEFTESMLQASARAYDPALHRASICVGHPKTDGPAYGVVKSLQLDGGDLLAEPDAVDPQFAELVNTKRFHTVSAAFYPPDSKRNPVPGVFYLRHVGFLGAEPPALKGLRPPEFAEADDDGDFVAFAEIEFGEGGFTVARLFRSLRDYLIGTVGQERADQVLPSWDVGHLEDIARRENDPTTSATPAIAFSETAAATTPQATQTQQEPDVSEPTPREKELQAQLDAVNAQIAATQAAAAQAERAQREASAAEFAEGLVKSDQLLPKDRALVAAVLVALEGDTQVEFGEGDDKAPAGTAFRQLLGGLPKHALNGKHIATKGGQAGVDANDAQAIANAAVEFQETEAKAGRHVTTAMAVEHVLNG